MKYKNITNLNEAGDVRKLYHQSFPECERIDFSEFFSGAFDGFSLVGQYENQKLVGMMHFIQTPAFVHLNYFAITPDMRSNGYGSKCLNWLKRKFPKQAIVVDVEEIDENSPNSVDRKRRQKFYMKNGLKRSGCVFDWQGTVMTYMSTKPLNESAFLKHITHLFPTITNIRRVDD